MNSSVIERLGEPHHNAGRDTCGPQLRFAIDALRRISLTALAVSAAMPTLCGSPAAQTDRATRVWYAARERVDVYKGPSEASPVIVRVPVGTKLVEIGKIRSWIEVAIPKSANKTGFVHRLSVSRKPPDRR